MVLCFDLPQDWAYTIVGATVLTDIRLHNRVPKERTRLQWSSGPQTLATTATITATRTTPFVPRGGAMLSLIDVPIGLKITVVGKTASGATVNLGGNSQTQRVGVLAGGAVGVAWVFEAGLPAIVGYVITIFNDVGGAVALAAGATIDLGEILLARGLYLPHVKGWIQRRVDSSKVSRDFGGSVGRLVRPNWRKLAIQPAAGTNHRNGGLEGGLDDQALLEHLANDPFVYLVDDVSSPALIQRSALFGYCTTLPGIASLAKNAFQFESFDVEEIPS